MSNYATALQTSAQFAPTYGGANHVPGTVPHGAAHAVEWPDPQGRPWDEMATLCGRSTLGMELNEQNNPTGWPPGKWARKACSSCSAKVQ